MTTAFHASPYGRFIEKENTFKKKKLHRTNQGSNALESNFSNRDNGRIPIQFRRERQTEHLKRSFFFKNRPIHFHINSTRVIKPVKRKKMRFSGYPWMGRLPPPLALRKLKIFRQKNQYKSVNFVFLKTPIYLFSLVRRRVWCLNIIISSGNKGRIL